MWGNRVAGKLSTPEQKCIGSPEQKYINDVGKKPPELGAFRQASGLVGMIRRCVRAGMARVALALIEPVAVAIHLQDMDVMSEPVEQRACEPLGTKHAGPFVEWQVRGDDG